MGKRAYYFDTRSRRPNGLAHAFGTRPSKLLPRARCTVSGRSAPVRSARKSFSRTAHRGRTRGPAVHQSRVYEMLCDDLTQRVRVDLDEPVLAQPDQASGTVEEPC